MLPPSKQRLIEELKSKCCSDNTCKYGGHNRLSIRSQIKIKKLFQSGSKLENLALHKTSKIDENLVCMGIEACLQSQDIKLCSNPQNDEICMVFIELRSDASRSVDLTYRLVLINQSISNLDSKRPVVAHGITERLDGFLFVQSEYELIWVFVYLVQYIDPDIIFTYDAEKGSLFLLTMRAKKQGIGLSGLIGRRPSTMNSFRELRIDPSKLIVLGIEFLHRFLQALLIDATNCCSKPIDHLKTVDISQSSSTIKICGRIILNIWRIARSETKLKSYTIEEVFYQLLGRRSPTITDHTLYQYIVLGGLNIGKVIDYKINRLNMASLILHKIGTITNMIEMSKVFGINFENVLNRGSQFKVEAALLRIAKMKGYTLLSASKIQVAEQPPLRCQALIIEPPKQFFVDPVVVVDFQSLYPSIMIAHNICYSSCIGDLTESCSNKTLRLGVNKTTEIDFESIGETPSDLEKNVFVAPNKVAYVRKAIRPGIIPQILEEFLQTRIMIKRSSKLYNNSQLLSRLEGRQMALKLFMNVMYGYTGAGVTGRMPCGDIADSIVEIGRQTMLKCIRWIQDDPIWRAKVIYGDTDSLFILLEGRSIQDAADIGEDICRYISSKLPFPMELKFEKVLRPFISFSKKRYAGNLYNSGCDKNPSFFSKGIETSRRDGINACVNLMEDCLQKIFASNDISELRGMLTNTWNRIFSNNINPIDFIFQREVKLGSYKVPPASAYAAELLGLMDPMKLPKRGERIKYIIVSRPKIEAIKDVAVPFDSFVNSAESIWKQYYINNAINKPLSRLFQSFSVDISLWLSLIQTKVNLTPFRCYCCGLTLSTPNIYCRSCSSQPQLIFLVSRSRLSQILTKSKIQRTACIYCKEDLGDCSNYDCSIRTGQNIRAKRLARFSDIEELTNKEWQNN